METLKELLKRVDKFNQAQLQEKRQLQIEQGKFYKLYPGVFNDTVDSAVETMQNTLKEFKYKVSDTYDRYHHPISNHDFQSTNFFLHLPSGMVLGLFYRVDISIAKFKIECCTVSKRPVVMNERVCSFDEISQSYINEATASLLAPFLDPEQQ